MDETPEAKEEVSSLVLNENVETPNDVSQEPDEHLSRVQVELEKLNYANESINNLELELEESRREYIQTANETDLKLSSLEKKLGNCVEKAKPYYEARIELNELKKKYLVAKNLFETAQELYVAAKNMQMYAEENLENFALGKNQHQVESQSGNYDKETLTKMLEIAKIKVNETELSKQSSDIEQIQAFRIYEEQRIKCQDLEKTLRRSIEKSQEYYEEKSKLYEELRFLYTKIECLKSCLKEAKATYQDALHNLESISTEIHEQRQSLDPSYSIPSREEGKDINLSKLNSNSESSFSSLSSLVSTSNQNKSAKSLDQSDINLVKDDEDFDTYFQGDFNQDSDVKFKKIPNNSKTDSNPSKIKDELIENLKLDNKLKLLKNKLGENAQKNDKKNNQTSTKSLPSSPIISKFKLLFN
ncbi:SH3 domain-binding 5-like [Brachionus plicatilis]|uniref:SH3 domain-binding 5-like n=1 Tax=Brachionus plicatilis TaxID=10195 RepID=A0A3M7SPE6_BRAPC|nr:SH3 domain-binding 5-like [Brachionus plicatilis]